MTEAPDNTAFYYRPCLPSGTRNSEGERVSSNIGETMNSRPMHGALTGGINPEAKV